MLSKNVILSWCILFLPSLVFGTTFPSNLNINSIKKNETKPKIQLLRKNVGKDKFREFEHTLDAAHLSILAYSTENGENTANGSNDTVKENNTANVSSGGKEIFSAFYDFFTYASTLNFLNLTIAFTPSKQKESEKFYDKQQFKKLPHLMSWGDNSVNMRLDIKEVDNQRIAYITFRGSAELQDWLINFSPGVVDLEDGLAVHGAMWNALNMKTLQLVDGKYVQMNILEYIRLHLIKAFEDDRVYNKLVFCGHSLGGAYAILTALAFHRNEYKSKTEEGSKLKWTTKWESKDIHVRAFGAPQIIISEDYYDKDGWFETFYENIQCYVHQYDPIPRLFSQLWLFHALLPAVRSFFKDQNWITSFVANRVINWFGKSICNLIQNYILRYYYGITRFTPLGKTILFLKDDNIFIVTGKSFLTNEGEKYRKNVALEELEKLPTGGIQNIIDQHLMPWYLERVKKMDKKMRSDTMGENTRMSYDINLQNKDIKGLAAGQEITVSYLSPHNIIFRSVGKNWDPKLVIKPVSKVHDRRLTGIILKERIYPEQYETFLSDFNVFNLYQIIQNDTCRSIGSPVTLSFGTVAWRFLNGKNRTIFSSNISPKEEHRTYFGKTVEVVAIGYGQAKGKREFYAGPLVYRATESGISAKVPEKSWKPLKDYSQPLNLSEFDCHYDWFNMYNVHNYVENKEYVLSEDYTQQVYRGKMEKDEILKVLLFTPTRDQITKLHVSVENHSFEEEPPFPVVNPEDSGECIA
eukprot:CAMPEP_0114496774 /NCGR_PEP_ID=MMETSP0109-20121206/5950_1 /TAXON_ID=29199 /ORGANISM="Chlorarachnion reptans, Strain CCCM449" /LENGTH=750 /DNA_ID=CAMNT_0001674071 /DNA_START=72 /DNA_END=2324 /DNA_ORIENTATION=+